MRLLVAHATSDFVSHLFIFINLRQVVSLSLVGILQDGGHGGILHARHGRVLVAGAVDKLLLLSGRHSV